MSLISNILKINRRIWGGPARPPQIPIGQSIAAEGARGRARAESHKGNARAQASAGRSRAEGRE